MKTILRAKRLILALGVAFATMLAFGAASDVKINEIMAKNETTKSTKNGVSGIDWVELYNAGSSSIDVTGWCLGNDPTKSPSKWPKIEGKGAIPAKGYLVVWCDGDGKVSSWGANEAHVACNISGDAGKHTVFLAPTASEDAILQQLTMPMSFDDVSCAAVGASSPMTVFGENDSAQYSFDNSSWTAVSGSIGMTDSSAGSGATYDGIQLTAYQLRAREEKPAKSIALVKGYLDDASAWSQNPVETTVDKVAFCKAERIGGTDGLFTGYTAFPGVSGENFVVVIHASISVPSTGTYTFAVGSDDGFEATISQNGSTVATWYDDNNAGGEKGYYVNPNVETKVMTQSSLKAVSLSSGVYDFQIVYYNYTDSKAVLDWSVASGSYSSLTSENSTSFKLVGTSGCPVTVMTGGGSSGPSFAKDVTEEMLNKKQILYWKAKFNVSEEAKGACRLRVRHLDGFTAKINGTQFATAGARNAAEMMNYVDFEIPADRLSTSESNTLLIEAENDKISDPEFFLQAMVSSASGGAGWVYYKTPTPGAQNSADMKTPPPPLVEFSKPHGYKTSSFPLYLSCPDAPDKDIYYTLDGSMPTTKSTKYNGEISISKTSVVRAAVLDPDTILQTSSSATYLFVDQIISQTRSSVPSSILDLVKDNPEYVGGESSVQVLRYKMSTSVGGVSDLSSKLKQGFQDIPTVSLVMDPKDMFGSSGGIYTHALNSGIEWERLTMLEQINPNDASDEFSVACGVRIRGASSRNADYAKHGFHMIFREGYGYSRLDHPLFGSEGAKSFKRIDFRCEQNNAWQNATYREGHGAKSETMINEVFSRDCQRDMGQPYNRSRYYHLFINGVYWGVYQSEERVEQNYAADYMGGDKENYDVVRTANDFGTYTTGVVDGNTESGNSWDLLWKAYQGGFESDSNYNHVRGLDSTGVRNSKYPVLLDVTNLVCYLLTSQWGADGDSPANEGGMANNIIAYRNRVDGEAKRDGFQWNRHDAENTMGAPNIGGEYAGYHRKLSGGWTANTADLQWGSSASSANNLNPTALHCKLMKNAAYKRTFADLVQKHLLTPGGAMTVEKNKERYNARKAEIQNAVICELARWGSDGAGNVFDYDIWKKACDVDIEFIEKRWNTDVGANSLNKGYRALGWFPSFDAPTIKDGSGNYLTDGMKYKSGMSAKITAGTGTTIYYTTDGSEPADGSQTCSSGETITVPEAGMTIKARAKKDSEWSALTEIRILGSGTPTEGDEVKPGSTLKGTYDKTIALKEDGEYYLDEATFNAGITVADGAKVKLFTQTNKESKVSSVYAPGAAKVTLNGAGTLRLAGANTLMTVSNLVVKSGTFKIRPTGVSTNKTPIVNVLGYVEQTGGTIDILMDFADGTPQAYGIYVANKDPKTTDESGVEVAAGIIYATFDGGEFIAKVGGTKSSAVYINKGSVKTKFKGGETVNATLSGKEPRFVSASGDLEFKRCTVTATSTGESARVFKSDKDISITDPEAHFDVTASGSDNEIFASAAKIKIDEGVFELSASDDCFSAMDRISVNGGKIYAVSTDDDVFDSNGDMELNGGVILAYTTAKGHEAFDVEPEQTEESTVYTTHQLRVNGGVIFATGGSGSAWPDNTVVAGTCFKSAATSISGAYLSLTSAGVKYTAKLPVSSGTYALFATCPGYADKSFASSAPSSGSQDFHDYYVNEIGTTNQKQLRFYEIYGSTKTNATETSGDVGEYIVLTNISDKTVSLAGLKVNVEKLKDWKDKGESGSKCLFTLSSGEVPAYGSVRFEQTDFWSSGKISNGDIYLALTDSAGETIQFGEASFDLYASTDGGGAALRANYFSKQMTNDTDYWKSSTSADPVTPTWTVTFSKNNVKDSGATKTVADGTTLKSSHVPSYTGGSWDVNPIGQTIRSDVNFNYTVQDTPPSGDIATGGDRIYDITSGGKNYRVHEFTSTGAAKSFENVSGKALNVEYLVVGGGGAGGDGHLIGDAKYGKGVGGGGGGGGVVGDAATLSVGESWTINVGCGGSLYKDGERIAYNAARGLAGESVITGGSGKIASAPGGGSGASCTIAEPTRPQAGAAGGGAAGFTQDNGFKPGSGTFSSYLGGARYSENAGGEWSDGYAGGGGGANTPGEPGTSAGSGAGGEGLTSSITGTPVIYGAGGAGGVGGSASGVSAAPNTGCGGGGGSGDKANAGEGGSGIVIIRYKLDGSVTPTTEWDIPGTTGGINGKNGTGGVKFIDFTSVSLSDGKLTVAFEAGKVNANGQTFGLVCKKNLADKDTFKISVKLTDDGTGSATVGVLEGETNEPQLFIVGIGDVK